MIVNVVISKATRVPCRNLALFNCRRQPTTYRGPFVALTITTKKTANINHSSQVFSSLYIYLQSIVLKLRQQSKELN